MLAIAIDDNRLRYYEGTQGGYGHPLWPAPVVTVATVLDSRNSRTGIPNTNYLPEFPMVFREDAFDAVTRLRRGRLYSASNTRPEDWNVQPHPAYPEDMRSSTHVGARLRMSLYAFHAWPAMRAFSGRLGSTFIALGTRDAYTLWRVVDIERIVTGEDLLALRAQSALGVIPEVNFDAVPQDARQPLSDALEKLSLAAFTASGDAVVELARNAAQWMVGVWLADKHQNAKLRHEELGPLSNMLLASEKRLAAYAGQAIAHLHTRVKLNERDRRRTRPIVSEDAEFALAAVGTLLRELSWAA